MAEREDNGAPKTTVPSVTVYLYTPDEALGAVWRRTAAPPGFRLERLPALDPVTPFASPEPFLLLVDADSAAAAELPLAEALEANLHRVVWTGPAKAIDRLGPARLHEAYDVVPTPVTPALLARWLADWARNIERTAALDRLGRRADHLAEENSRLAAQLAEVQQEREALVRQRERLLEALQRVRQVARLSQQVNSLDLDAIVEVCVHQLPDLVGARRASLYFYDPAGDRLVLQRHSHDGPIAERIDLASHPNSPMALAVRGGRMLLIDAFDRFERQHPEPLERPYQDHYATDSCIVIPLLGSGRVLGVLNLADKADGSRFNPEVDLPVIEQIAQLIGASLYNVELFREMEHRAKTDPLTGLTNRRALEEAIAREIDRAQRYGSPLAVLMIDVDGLKHVNDRYGHLAGDAVLQNIAAVLIEAVRSVDVPGRWAGDEFLVILPGTTAAQAEQLARRLLDRGHGQPAHFQGQAIPATFSIGATQYLPDETQETLLARVDEALYQAKAAGRDTVATAGPSTSAGPAT